MPEVKLSPLEQRLEKLFKDHDIALPRNLRSSLCGLIAGEVTSATGAQPALRDHKLPTLPERIRNSRYQDE